MPPQIDLDPLDFDCGMEELKRSEAAVNVEYFYWIEGDPTGNEPFTLKRQKRRPDAPLGRPVAAHPAASEDWPVQPHIYGWVIQSLVAVHTVSAVKVCPGHHPSYRPPVENVTVGETTKYRRTMYESVALFDLVLTDRVSLPCFICLRRE